MMPLFEGAAILVLVVMFGVSVATSLLIERQRLFALADSAALVGSESFDPTLLRQGADGIVVTLDSARVRAAEGNFLDRSDSSVFEALVLEAAGTPDGQSAEVELSALWRPPRRRVLWCPVCANCEGLPLTLQHRATPTPPRHFSGVGSFFISP